jgi:DUF917 family protein
VVYLRTLNKEDMLDYLIASAILSCGHSEDDPRAKTLIDDIEERGLKVRLADPWEVPDDELLCTASFQGGGGIPSDIRDWLSPYKDQLEKAKPVDMLRKAVSELSSYIGEEFYSFLCICTSPFQCSFPMYLSALEDKPYIDGDTCGRARPGVYISLPNVAGISLTPLVLVTPLGETLILKERADDLPRTGDLVKGIHFLSGASFTAVASSPTTMKDYRGGMVMNQFSRCIEIGGAIRKARETGTDPVKAFMKTAKATRIFEGVVKAAKREARIGYTWGTWNIEGIRDFAGHDLKIWWKNENLISWIDGKPYVTCPDLICVVDNANCRGLGVFPEHQGKVVTVFGLPAHDLWKSQKGVELWNPRRYGFDIEYRPLEQLETLSAEMT